MKKAILFLSAAFVVLAACNKYEKDVVTTPSTSGNAVTFNVSVTNADDTKAVKNGWANGDKIYVFFEGLAAKWLVLTYDGSAWDAADGAAEFVAGDFSTLGTKELTAVHTPASVTVAWDGENSKFTFTDNSTNAIKPIYNYYLLDKDRPFTVDGTTVNVTLSMGRPDDFVWFYVDGISANVDQFYLKEDNLTPTAPVSVALAGGVTEDTKTAGYPIAGVALSTGGIYAGKVGSQTTYAFQLVKVNSVSDMIATRTYTKSGTKKFDEGKQYNLGAYTSMTENMWVDLGLPSGTKWATANLGIVESVPQIGGSTTYFSWGDVAPKGTITSWRGDGDTYFWTTYKYSYNCTPNTGSKFSKYVPTGKEEFWNNYDAETNPADNKTVLDNADDPAYVLLGGSWSMPTAAMAQELFDNTTYDQYTVANVGLTGPNGLNLKLTRVGFIYGTGTSDWPRAVIPTKTLDTTSPGYAISLELYRLSEGENPPFKLTVTRRHRYNGMPIRPVYN